FGDDAQPAVVRLVEEAAELAQRAVGRVNAAVVGDVVALVAQGRRVERQQPQRGDTEVLPVVELLREPGKIPDAVAVAVVERAHVHLVDDRVAVPGGLGRQQLCARLTSRRRAGALTAHGALPFGLTVKMCAGTEPGSSCTKLRAPCHSYRAFVS